MDDLVYLLLFILLSTLLLSFLQRRVKDACLKNFERDFVDIQYRNGTVRTGTIRVESTGIELSLKQAEEKALLIYQQEYDQILYWIRHLASMDAAARKRRDRNLKRVYEPTFLDRQRRRFVNLLKLTRDAVLDFFQIIVGRVQKVSAIGYKPDKQTKAFAEQVTKMVGTAYEPLLERHIGNRVLVETVGRDGAALKLEGILREYTSDFVQLMDVAWEDAVVDLVLSRKIATVRAIL